MIKPGKKQVIIAGAVIALIFILYRIFFTGQQSNFNYEEVKKSDISQEVSVSGQVKKGEELALNFNASGKLKKIYVKEGDEVEQGQRLAEIDSSQLLIQLQSYLSQLKIAQAGLEKLLAGAGQEDISLARTALQNAQLSYQSIRQKHSDAEETAKITLDNLYKSSLSSLADAKLEAYNALEFLQSNIYLADSRDLTEAKEEIEKIAQAYQEGSDSLTSAQASGAAEQIDSAIEKIKILLETACDSSSQIRDLWDFRSSASAAQKTSLDTYQDSLNTSLLSVITVQNNIAAAEIANQSSINTAWAAVVTAQGQLDVARESLDKLLASPRREDVDLAQAQVSQAQSQVNLLNHQIKETTIISPIEGKISQIGKKEGEQVPAISAGQDFIVLIPKEPFQVEINIPEVDIGKVETGDVCRIDLDAFPDEQFSGKVIKIDPAETIIAGVVYYKTTISLESEDQKIRPGMTANVIIITETREGSLSVPQRAVFEKNGKRLVRIVTGKEFEEREVQTGIKGVKGEIEIISGLDEGDKVVTFLKED
ncbi:MAG: efflux RND transporter periplasmic adaptor subunit [Candidatus Pacebacteria bacterium]|nr:efflux RND transporter periplasmic adaptor subunit [Candidatus Paceibacterota bacterium]